MCFRTATAKNLNVAAIFTFILNYSKCLMMPGWHTAALSETFDTKTRTLKLNSLLSSVLLLKLGY